MRCKYIRKIFQNEENGYTVALFSTLNQEVPLSARDKFGQRKKSLRLLPKDMTFRLRMRSKLRWKASGKQVPMGHNTRWKLF